MGYSGSGRLCREKRSHAETDISKKFNPLTGKYGFPLTMDKMKSAYAKRLNLPETDIEISFGKREDIFHARWPMAK